MVCKLLNKRGLILKIKKYEIIIFGIDVYLCDVLFFFLFFSKFLVIFLMVL